MASARVATVSALIGALPLNAQAIQAVAIVVACVCSFLALHRANKALDAVAPKIEAVIDANRDALREALSELPPDADA